MKNNRRKFIKQMSMVLVAVPLTNFNALTEGISDSVNDFEYKSKFYKIKLSQFFPFIQFFSTDSLGKGILEKNTILGSKAGAQEYELRKISAKKVAFYSKTGDSKKPAWVFEFTPKKITIESNFIDHNNNQAIKFNFNKIINHATLLGLMKEEKKTMLPAVLHLPDLGSFRIFSSNPDAIVDYDANRDVTEPYISVSFPSATEKQQSVEYFFETALIYTDFPGADQPEYDAYRRNYINIFQINPVVQGYANNSCSDACSFTLYWSSLMALHTPNLIGSLTALDLLKMSLERYMKGMKSYGLLGYPIWNSPYNSLDAFPSLVISACNYFIGSKDIKWAEKNYSTIQGWLDEQMKRDIDNDGLVSYELSGNSGSWNKYKPANWWDTIGFGHDDAYSNALTYDALNLFVATSNMLGKANEAEKYQKLADNLKNAYYKTFYNPKTGILAGWRSQDGKLHDYYFLFVNAIAIYYDLVPIEKQKEIMEILWSKMKEVGLTDFKYGLPGNLVSIRYEDYTFHEPRWGGGLKEDGSDAFQIYENGGLSANYVYYTLKAFQKTGLKKYADKIINDMLVSFDLGDFQGSCADGTRDWKDWNGNCKGYEGLLCDGYLTFLAMNPSL